jgi:bla regulator protein blaR1
MKQGMAFQTVRAIAGSAAVVGGIVLSLNAHRPAPQSTTPAFEAASVKPNKSGDANSMRNVGAGGRMVFTNNSLRQLITAAYDIQPFQLIGGPSWVGTDRFDVVATAGINAPLAQLNLMMRSLLADRFTLVVHLEKRELPIYVLVKARQDGRLGPALKPATIDCGPTGRGRAAPGATPGPVAGCRAWMSPTGVDFAGQSMGELATVLGMQLGRPVVDKTGLSGGFDLQLSFAPEGGRGPAPATPASDPSAPSLFAALQEQLGLKLESQRGPMDVVVIESVEQPTPD